LNSEKAQSSKLKRVVYLWNYIEWGGAQIYFFALIKEVKKHCDVLVVLPTGSDPQLITFLDNLKVKYEFIDAISDNRPAHSLKRKVQRHFNKVICEYKTLKYLRNMDLSDSILHIELAPWQSLIALRALVKNSVVFTTIHNNPVTRNKIREILWKTKVGILCKYSNFNLFASNKYTKNALSRLAPKSFRENISITYTAVNPVEIEQALTVELNREELIKKFNLPQKETLVFVVGQFIDRKGRWIFLEAAEEIVKTHNDIGFVWISNSKPADSDLNKVEEYNLEGNFRLITSDQVGKERIDLFTLMRMADIFALPSFVEGLPISLLEGMALGKPSVSTNVYAIPEACKHMETGILIEPGNSNALSQAILTLKNDKELSKKVGDAGREFVLQNFDEREVAKIAYKKYIDACG
jgi:glycosyltransferase involved in cell wall biosynthesis